VLAEKERWLARAIVVRAWYEGNSRVGRGVDIVRAMVPLRDYFVAILVVLLVESNILKTRPALVWSVTVFAVILAICLLLLFIAFTLLRRHHHRVSRMKPMNAERVERPRVLSRPDAWSESARRMSPERVKDETSDTVDFDPRELNSEDIWPPDDDPRNDPGRN
jgi:hypothetical protein